MEIFSVISPYHRDGWAREQVWSGLEVYRIFLFPSTVRKKLKKARLEASNDIGWYHCPRQIAGHFAQFLVVSVGAAFSETLSWHEIEWQYVTIFHLAAELSDKTVFWRRAVHNLTSIFVLGGYPFVWQDMPTLAGGGCAWTSGIIIIYLCIQIY